MLCLPYYACVFSSTKLVIRTEQDLPGTEWGMGWGKRIGKGARWRNDPNNEWTCE
jgi:hypothetical protein